MKTCNDKKRFKVQLMQIIIHKHEDENIITAKRPEKMQQTKIKLEKVQITLQKNMTHHYIQAQLISVQVS